MESTRKRQQREIVDEDLNLGRRVFALNEKQVKAFDETVLPRKTRDIESEISVDKLIESLNKTLESKQVALEFLLTQSRLEKGFKKDSLQAYNQLVVNGDVVSVYNQIIRIFLQNGLSRSSYDSIKVKLQELKPNIDAIDFGLGEVVQLLFESNSAEVKQVTRLIQAQAVYRNIKNQL
jgi:hypothetical protein